MVLLTTWSSEASQRIRAPQAQTVEKMFSQSSLRFHPVTGLETAVLVWSSAAVCLLMIQHHPTIATPPASLLPYLWDWASSATKSCQNKTLINSGLTTTKKNSSLERSIQLDLAPSTGPLQLPTPQVVKVLLVSCLITSPGLGHRAVMPGWPQWGKADTYCRPQTFSCSACESGRQRSSAPSGCQSSQEMAAKNWGFQELYPRVFLQYLPLNLLSCYCCVTEPKRRSWVIL